MTENANCESPQPFRRHRQDACATADDVGTEQVKQARQGGTGFQPVDPWKSQALQMRWRNLPHMQAPESTYFVTFRCRPGIILAPNERGLVLSAVRHWDRSRIDLDAAVIMPDHVHALFRITDGSALGQILHSVKSYSAKQVKKARGIEGSGHLQKWVLWVDESFDRIMRSEAEWREKIAYISQNPTTAGLMEHDGQYPWLYFASQTQPNEQGNRAAGIA